MSWSAFRPTGNTIAIAVTTTAGAGVQAPSSGGETQSVNYLVSNATTQAAFLAYGPPGVIATIPTGTGVNSGTGFWIPPSSVQSYTFGANSYFSAIASTGTTTLYITPGDGL